MNARAMVVMARAKVILASAMAMDVQVRVTSARAEEKVERLMRIIEAFPSKSSPKPITQKADLENQPPTKQEKEEEYGCNYNLREAPGHEHSSKACKS